MKRLLFADVGWHKAGLLLGLGILLCNGLQGQQRENTQRRITGVAVDSVTNTPIPYSIAVVPELEIRVTADRSGRFVIDDIDASDVWLTVTALGYWSKTQRVDLTRGEADVSYALIQRVIELDAVMVSTGTARERMLSESLHPTSVLRGQELNERFDVSLAATLDGVPGVTSASMGPATGQPIIRGLGGDRVLVLEDGQRSGDLSHSGPDHAVAVEPISAQRVEVVRGPAALLYGSNALGGVINVIREEVPRSLPARAQGAVVLQGQSMNRGGGANAMGVGAIKSLTFRGEINTRQSGDLRTPIGVLESTDVDNVEGSVGTSLIQDWGYVGGAYRYLTSSYGVPGGFLGAHATGVRIDMKRQAAKAEGSLSGGIGPLEELDFKAGWTRYEHEEWEPGGILGTRFLLYTTSGEAAGHHGRIGPFSEGSVGVRGTFEDYTTGGTQDTPPSRKLGFAGYVLEQIEVNRFRFEIGGRFDWTRITPLDTTTLLDIGTVRTRNFTAVSGSFGVLYDLGSDTKIGVTTARAFRTPDYVELFSQGPHLAAHSFEVGNPDLGLERGTGADVFLRVDKEVFHLDVAGFYNRINDYVFPRNTGEISRVQLPIYQFDSETATMVGAEGDVWLNVHSAVRLAGSVSYVRGTIMDSEEPLPLIPPLSGGANVRFQTSGFFISGGFTAANEQSRVAEFEEPTDGYALFNASTGIQWFKFGWMHSITLRANNLTDVEYRNHLSRVKAVMPEAGRNMTIVYRVDF